jgi:glycosyltransferase involved in cell wall biosynthesis
MLAIVHQTTRRSSRRIVHVITDSGPHPLFRTLIESGAFDRANLTVGCVGSRGPLYDEMRSLGVATFALGARSRRNQPIAVERLVQLLRRTRAEVVQTHLVDGSLVGLAAARLARARLAIMTAHHSHELPFHGRRLLWPERLCAGPLCDRIIAPSDQVAATLTRLAHVPADKISVVHHGFDLKRLDPDLVDGSRVRRELGLEDKLVFGAIGRIYWIKNYRALLEAFALTLRDTPEARLLIVGSGDPSELTMRAAEFGIGDRVIVTGHRADIPEVLAALDVFVHPALAESFGMVIIEAMAMAKPVLTTPVGIAPEVVRDGVTGVLSRGADSADLAAGLRSIFALRSRWQALGAAAKREVSGFTATHMGSRYAELYDTCLSETSTRRPR